jgi:hypothetical protein
VTAQGQKRHAWESLLTPQPERALAGAEYTRLPRWAQTDILS